MDAPHPVLVAALSTLFAIGALATVIAVATVAVIFALVLGWQVLLLLCFIIYTLVVHGLPYTCALVIMLGLLLGQVPVALDPTPARQPDAEKSRAETPVGASAHGD